MSFKKPEHEYFARLYDSQKEKSQNFLKVLTILIGFTFLFFFLMLLPYVSLQKNDAVATKALDEVNQQIKKNEEEIKPYTEVQNSIANLKKEINDSTRILKDYIQEISIGNPSIQQPLEIFQICSNLDHSPPEFIRCNVNEKVLDLIKGYNNTIFTKVIAPLQKNATQLFDVGSLKIKTMALMNSFKNITLSTNLTESELSKTVAADEQQKQLEKYWSEFGSVVQNEVKKINATLISLQNTRDNLTFEKQQLASAKSNITQRLDEVQFPLGKIPLGINEAISLFPFGIIAGFIVLSILLYQATRLRMRYHIKYVRKYDNSYVRTGKMISEELPIWIDPVSHWIIQILKSLVILIPFIIFLVSWSLITDNWKLNSSVVSESILFGDRQTNQQIFNISNYIVLGLFIVCYGVIGMEWYLYQKSYMEAKKNNPKA